VYADFICREIPMTRAALAVTLLLSPLVLAAQAGSSAGSFSFGVASLENGRGSVASPPGFTANACPIGMHADQGVWDHTMRIREGDKRAVIQPFGQKISLTLKDSRGVRITAATVRVHGLTGENRIVQTSDKTGGSDAVRTVQVSFGRQGEAGVTGDLWIPGFTAVTLIELREVSYSDGTAWKVSGSSVCRVQPDPLMLISNR
jgi:hypothetical protein